MTAAKPTVEQEMVYQGRRSGQGGRVVYEYQPPTGDSVWYKTNLVPGAAVGSVIRVTRPADDLGVLYTRGEKAPRVVGFTDADEVTLLRWQVKDRGAYERKTQEDAAKRFAKRAGGLEPIITQLADAAASLSAYDRAAFSRYVADRIRGL